MEEYEKYEEYEEYEKYKAVVLFSGGVDSTTALALAIERLGRENVAALSITYGQKHKKEVEAAERIAAYYKVRLLTLDLAAAFRYSDCSLLEQNPESEIPKQSYAEQLRGREGKPVTTYVPFRNGLFLASAASIALSFGAEVIYYGAHSDDAAGNAYPDCSGAFNDAMNTAIYEGSGKQLRIEAPFVELNKKQVVAEGKRLGVPYEMTWSCYEGGDKPCGVCGTCRDRREAFLANGLDIY